ncbi:MAG: class I SAM-dependent methyltransferase, partial [Nanoarchaeota archaeon]
MKKIKSYDFFGSIAVVNFPRNMKLNEKKKFAQNLIKENKSIKTILEKSKKVSGKLRKPKTKHILGEKTKEVLYKENNCVFRFHIDKTYFSPRLSNERKEIASKIKKNDEVLVMFAGVGVFSIAIAKNSNAKVVYSNELNKKSNKYEKLNLELNKVKDRIVLIPGNIKKVAKKINKKFDVIVMPRPQLKESFLKEAFKLSKKGTRIYYYDFCGVNEINNIVEKIKKEARENNKDVKILKKKKAGEIAPYKIRCRIDFK